MDSTETQKQFNNIGDIARELGLSKTTVSRAISGKGRVSEETRTKVLKFIEECSYVPSTVARGLAENKTYNIALVMPKSFVTLDLPFLRKSMSAICEVAAEKGYDILLTMNDIDEYLPVKRILDSRKVDGVILARTITDDPLIDLLQERGIPFVAMGSLDRPGFYHVDNDQVEACKELTGLLLLQGYRNIGLFGGSLRSIVNQSRLEGFNKACDEMGYKLPTDHLYMGIETEAQMQAAVDDAVKKQISCFITMDDGLCIAALRRFKTYGLKVPRDVKIASFYDSTIIADHIPPITALHFDAVEMGRVACNQLLALLDGTEIEKDILLGYQVIMRQSTK